MKNFRTHIEAYDVCLIESAMVQPVAGNPWFKETYNNHFRMLKT